MGKVRLEFTVEPFDDGRPGPHVTAAIDAVAARGLMVDMGPFSTSVDAEPAEAFAVAHDLLTAAFENGATRVSLQAIRLDEASG